MSRGIKLTAVLCGSLIASQAGIPSAFADTVFWQGANSTNWFNDSNWVWDGHVPTAADEARIDVGSPYSPAISSTGAVANSLLIGITGSGTLTVDGTSSAAALMTGTTSLGFADGSSGALIVTGADSIWTNTGSAYVGQSGTGSITITGGQGSVGESLYIGAGSGAGTVNVESGGDLDVTGTLFVGYSPATSISELNITSATASSDAASIADGLGAKGAGLVTGGGAIWTNTGLMTIGGGGVGSLAITDGGVVETESAGIGNQLQASGSSVRVDGIGSKLTVTDDLYVGNFGNATLTVENGGMATSSLSIIARLAGSTSTATVTGTSSLWNAGDLRVGGYDGSISNFGGNGTLNIEAGGKVSTTAVSIADVAGATGAATVTGADSRLESTGRIVVGRTGHGELTIEDTAQVSSVGASFANDAGSTATVTITGGGSGWTSTGNVYSGNLGNATLNILAGGLLSGVDGYVGTESGSNSSATIDGSGSIWTNSGDFFVGHNAGSVGEVTISDGGRITSVQGLLGDLLGSSGTMTVTRAGSQWETTGDLNVGRFGHGAMTISDGGTVTSNRSYLGNESGSDGNVLVTGAGSNWTTTGRLFVGTEGNGELTLTDGGSVTATEVVIAYGADSVGILNIGAARGATAALAGRVDSSTVRFGDGAGSLVFNFSNPTLTFAPSILGDGSLYLAGNTLTLTGTNSYTGTTTINGGVLSLGNGGTSGSIIGPATINAGGTLQFDRADDITYAGALSGTGALIKTGAGELDYTGNGAGFTGTTTVAAGLLSVNGTLGGAVDVLSGGTLGGNGTMGTATLLAGATVSPGNSIGTLHVNDDITFSPGSVYQVELAGNGTSDLIAATGQAFVNGGTVELTAIDPQTSYQSARTYTILTAQGGVVGEFDAAISQSPFLVVSVEDLLNGVGLTIGVKSPAGFSSVAVTPNEFAVGAALDTLAQSGSSLTLYNALLFLPSADDAHQAFNQLSGEVHASAQSVFMEQSSLIRGALDDRLRTAQGGVGVSSGTVVNVVETSSGALAYAAPSKVQVAADMSMPLKAAPVVAPVERFSLWTTGFGNWGSFDGTGNAAGITDSTGGFLIGADTLVGSGWRVGVAGGYSYSDFSSGGRSASGSSDNWHVGIYGGNVWGALALRTGLSYTWQDVSTSRQVAFAGFADSLSADYDTGTFQAFGELGWRMETALASFEPFANLAYVSLDTSGYLETGGAAALYSDGADMDTTLSTLGLRASKDIVLGTFDATLRGTIGWRHAFGDITPSITQALLTSNAFTITGVPIAEEAAVVEAGLDVHVGASTTVGIAYTGQFGDGVTQNGFNASLSVKF